MQQCNTGDDKKKILVVGGGGREHAMAWKLAQSLEVAKVFIAPGNGGTHDEPKVEHVAIAATAIEQLAMFAQEHAIDLTVVGPEAPLEMGIVDLFEQRGLCCLGPKKAAAQIEASKLFAKKFMQRHNIPTAKYATFDCHEKARAYIQDQLMPIVIKADGLTAGKGVITAFTHEQAYDAIDQLLVHKRFGQASQTIIIEEFLTGQEISFFVLSDGERIQPLTSVQDHKHLHEGNKGPTTGGMGAISPVSWVTEQLHERIMQEVMQPTIDGLCQEGTPFVGFLYAGLMVSPSGEPKVLEFNCRLGDPETQPMLMRLQSDFYSLCQSVLEGTLEQQCVVWSSQAAVGLVLASGGYPLQYQKGYAIDGLPMSEPGVKVFHAGTVKKYGRVVTNGGRVLCVTALGETVHEARELAYDAANTIQWPGRFYRSDIGRL